MLGEVQLLVRSFVCAACMLAMHCQSIESSVLLINVLFVLI